LAAAGNAVSRLALGADEQDAAALGDGADTGLEGRMQQSARSGPDRRCECFVRVTEDVLTHLRVPAVGLMAEVDASFNS